jgi:DNA-binding NarL/FixJ family response regulator
VIRVLVADDQALVRSGFRMILDAQPDITVVAEAGDGAEAVEQAQLHRPDVALVDIRMPKLDGIAATRRIVELTAPATRVLILTTFDLDEYVYEAVRAGASGFLLKDAPPARLAEGVRTVAAGEALLAPSITRRLLDRFARRAPASGVAPGLADLTAREREVLAHVARGLSNSEIAGVIGVGEATVKTHVTRVLSKLALRDRVQVVIFAYEWGISVPGAPHASEV